MDRNAIYEEPEGELDLVELFWDFLSQWKAILIFALAIAIVVPSAKLLKDTRDYNVMVGTQEAATAAQAGKSSEELVEEALARLSDEDRATVQRLAKQHELAMNQEAYLNDSVLLSGDLANQQQLQMRFYLTSIDGTPLQPLADAYKALLSHDSVMEHIGAALDPKADVKYIRELVSLSTGTIPDSAATGLIATVSVVLTPDADVSAVRNAVTEELGGFKDSLTHSIGKHEITLIDAEQTQTYNTTSMERRVTLTNGVNNLLNTYNTAVKSLTADQKTALDAINKIASGETATTPTTNQAKAPTFSLKFALIGFVGGIFAYAVIFIAVVALRKRIATSSDAEIYTACRLLGDVYFPQHHKGLAKLFHSKLVDRHRYGRKGSVSLQIEKVVSTVSAVCEHAGTTSATILCMGCAHGKASDIAKGVVADIKATGIKSNTIEATGDMDEKALLDAKNAIFIIGSDAKTSDVWRITELCHNYEVERLGCVFLREY